MEYELNRFYKFLEWVAIIGVTILISLMLHKCNNSEPNVTLQKVTTKEVNGSFEAKEVMNIPIRQKPTRQNLSNSVTEKNSNTENAFLQKQIDKLLVEKQELIDAFFKSNPTQKDSLYEKAIQLNEFSQTFDDDKVKIDVSGIAQGTVKSMQANYTIKPQTIEVPVKQKERVFALKTGIEYGNSIELNKGVFKGNLEFENKKGNSYNAGYDTDKRIWLGYKITIFDIKR